MKQFKFKNTEKTADSVMKAIEARARRQSNLYRIGFIVLTFVFGMYLLDALSVKTYDGYISHKDTKMRAVANMSIVEFYVKPGDIVNEGDTLYSQLMIDWLEDQVNPFSTNIANEKKRESNLRIAKYESEIIEINNNIYSLHSTINEIKEEIRTGVKTEDELVNLNLALAERIEESKHLRRAIKAEYDMQYEYNYTVSNTSSLVSQSLSERRANLQKYGNALRYRVAYVDSKIINIKAANGMITPKHEEVLTFQPIGHPDMTNSHIEMIVEADKYGEIKDGMEVDVYAGNRRLCEANVSFLGVRMAEAYANIESILDRTSDINGKLIISLKFKDGYELPEEYFIHNYPVKIRHRVWAKWSDILSWMQWFKH